MTESRDEFFSEAFETNTDGEFDCMTCFEYVDSGFLDISNRCITYKCSKGHISKVELKGV